MALHFQNVLGEAIARLKRADVLGATAIIQRSLGIGSLIKRPTRSSPKSASVDPQALVRGPGKAGQASASWPVDLPELPSSAKSKPKARPTALERAVGFTSRTFHSNAGSLSYKLYVSPKSTAGDPALVLMLHGCTQDPDDFARGTDMNRLADEFGFIIAYPHQPRAANLQGCWNWFDDRHQHRGSGEPVLLSGLAQELAREFGIGGDRIFAAGLSAGGAMADVLASTYPEVFAAVGIHSGLPYGAAKNMVSAFAAMKGGGARARPSKTAKHPVVRKIIFHGDADGTVNAANGQQIFDRARSQEANGAEITTDTAINGRKVTRTSVEGPDGGALIEHWVVHGSGHAWAGGKQGGSYVDTAGPNASREMVRFFLQR